MVPSKYLSNFWRTLEMPLTNCEIKHILTWFRNCVIIYTDVNNPVPIFTITEKNLYIPIVTLSTEDNVKLLPQLKQIYCKTRIISTRYKFKSFNWAKFSRCK